MERESNIPHRKNKETDGVGNRVRQAPSLLARISAEGGKRERESGEASPPLSPL